MSEMNLDCKDIFSVPQMSKVSCFLASDVSPPCNLTVNSQSQSLPYRNIELNFSGT